MKRLWLICLFLIGVGASTMQAQFNASKLTFGGGIGVQLGDYTLVNFSPQVGYNLTNRLNVGAGLMYTHYSNKYDFGRYKETGNYCGLNVYTKFYPLPYLVMMVQPELSRMWKTVKNQGTGEEWDTDKLIPACVVGAGFRLGAVTAMLQYDLAQNSDSPYGNKIFYSVGYTFSF